MRAPLVLVFWWGRDRVEELTRGSESDIITAGEVRGLEQAKKRDHKVLITDAAIEKVGIVELSDFSVADLDTFICEGPIKTMSVVTNQGEVYVINKTSRFDYNNARQLMVEDYDSFGSDTIEITRSL